MIKSILTGLVLSLFVSSCAHNSYRAPSSESNYWVTRIKGEMAKFDAAKFKEDETPISDVFMDKEKLYAISTKACVKTSESVCSQRVLKILGHRLDMHYYLANKQEVAKFMEAYPEYNDKPRIFELLYIESHNKEVERRRGAWLQQERRDTDQMMMNANP